jgi:hypothetical protein
MAQGWYWTREQYGALQAVGAILLPVFSAVSPVFWASARLSAASLPSREREPVRKEHGPGYVGA